MKDIDNYILSEKNLSIETLMKKFNVSISTAYLHLRKNNVKLKKSNERNEKIKQYVQEGKTYESIGKLYGISRQCILI